MRDRLDKLQKWWDNWWFHFFFFGCVAGIVALFVGLTWMFGLAQVAAVSAGAF